MARVIAVLLFSLLLLAIAGYLYYSGKDHEIRISEAQIQAKLSEKLPQTKTYLFIFDLTLDNPRIKLQQDSGRIAAGLDLQLRLGDSDKQLRGSVDASGRLRYASEEGQFYLAQPKIEQLTIEGLPDRYRDKARSAIELALAEYYAKHPVYTLKSGDIKQAAAKLVLKDVRVSGDELIVTLGI